MTDRPVLLTINEVANYLSVHPKTVTAWCRTGEIPAVKVGGRWYIRSDRLDEALDPGSEQV